MEKIASKLMEQVKDFAEKNPKLVTGLAATGGAGALAGALMTGKEDENESGLHRFGRRLQNALLTGGLAAGATGLAMAGVDKLQNALPEGDVSPASAALHSNLVRGLGAAGLGSVGAGVAARNSQSALDSIFGKGKMTKDRLTEILGKMGLKGGQPAALETLSKAYGDNPEAIKKFLVDKVGIDTAKIKWDAAVPAEIRNQLGANDFAELNDKVTKFMDKHHLNVHDKLTKAIDKNKKVLGVKLQKVPGINNVNKMLSPEYITKLLRAAKRNKLMLGAGAVGLALPEIVSGTGSAVGSMFGSSLYE